LNFELEIARSAIADYSFVMIDFFKPQMNTDERRWFPDGYWWKAYGCNCRFFCFLSIPNSQSPHL